VISFLLFAVNISHAAPTKVRTTVSGQLQRFGSFVKTKKSKKSTGPKASMIAEPPKLETSVPGFGAVTFEFSSIRGKDWDSSFSTKTHSVDDNKLVTLFSGEAIFKESGKRVPAAASVYKVNGVQNGFIHFPAPGTSEGENRKLFELNFKLEGGNSVTSAQLILADEDDFEGKTCSEVDAPENAGPRRAAIETAGTSLRILQLATEADKEFFDLYGVNSNAQMATIVNAADTIYQRDLNLDIEISQQNTATTVSQPYNSTDPLTLLNQFRTTVVPGGSLGTADAFHLFTGKELDSSTVGLAWVGVVCSNPTHSHGLTQHLSSALDYVIFAHELGHNLSGNHDSSLPATIMYPSVGTNHTTFSSGSITEIGTHVTNFGSCLAAAPTATPTPTASPTASPSPTATSTSAPSPTSTQSPEPTVTASPEPTTIPTALPTAFPTSVPTADPTIIPRNGPDPSDPTDGFPAPETTNLNLKSVYSSRTGIVDSLITLSGEVNSICGLRLQLADNLAFQRAKTVTLRHRAKTRVMILTGTSVRNSNERVYLRAVYGSCGGTTVSSETSQITPYAQRFRVKESAARWISRIR